MLSLNEFSAGHLKDVKEQSLLLPRDKYGTTILIAPTEGVLTAFFLDGNYSFHSFEASNNSSFSGLLIPAVEVLVDQGSIFNPDSQDIPVGALVRKGSSAMLFSIVEDGRFRERKRVLLTPNLPALSEDLSVAFYRWDITIGQGAQRRTLHTVDVTPG